MKRFDMVAANGAPLGTGRAQAQHAQENSLKWRELEASDLDKVAGGSPLSDWWKNVWNTAHSGRQEPLPPLTPNEGAPANPSGKGDWLPIDPPHPEGNGSVESNINEWHRELDEQKARDD